MKALTIRQPWASLIACGAKTIETRSWATRYRGPLLIHAGKAGRGYFGVNYVKGTIFDRPQVIDRRTLHLPDGTEIPHPGIEEWPKGAVVAVAELVDVVPTDSCWLWFTDESTWVRQGEGRTYGMPSCQKPLGDFTPGRYAWLLDDVRALPRPVEARGRQGLWNPDHGLVSHVGSEFDIDRYQRTGAP